MLNRILSIKSLFAVFVLVSVQSVFAENAEVKMFAGGKTISTQTTSLSESPHAGFLRLKIPAGKLGGIDKVEVRAVLDLTEVPEHALEADLEAFSLKVVEKYYSTIRDEIKKFDPALLYMGCRFSDHNPAIISIAAKYCDVLSFNRYRYRMDNVGLPAGVDKPVIIGEFHFGSTADTGKFHTSLMFCANQKERAKAYKRYVSDALENPFIVGTHWHQFSDQATTGRFDGENFNVGFTDICDTPYAEMVEVLREVGKTMYQTRLGGN